MEEVRKKGDYLREKIAAFPGVDGVDGMGMMLGIRLKGKTAADVLPKCIENGLIPLSAKEKIRLLPPLSITWEELEKGTAILQKTLEELA